MKKITFFTLAIAILFCVVTGFSKKDSVENKNIKILELNSVVTNEDDNTVENGRKIEAKLERLKQAKEYNFPQILAVKDPYKFNTTGLYVYFKTAKATKIKENISVANTKNFKRWLKGKRQYSKTHEYLLTGIVPSRKNIITLTAVDKRGKKKAIRFVYNAPKILSESYKGLKIQRGTSKAKPIDGLFLVPMKENTSLLIDDDGVIRGELRFNLVNVQFKDGYLYNLIDSKISKVNNLGQIEKIYGSKNYGIHHDFTIANDDLYALATNKQVMQKENRVCDSVIKIDLKDGKVTELFDFKDLVPKLYKKATGVVKNLVLNNKGHRDNIHPNSINYMDGAVIISSRETSTIMKINVSGNKPKIEYFLSEPSIWKNIGYSEYLYQKVSNFQPNAGQHSVRIERNKNFSRTKYYLYMYDNNSAIMDSRPDFSWDGFSGVVKVPTVVNKNTVLPKGARSYYYKYLVNEKARTFKLVKKIALPFSFFQSNVMEINGHIIYGTSFKGAFGELDSNGKAINSFMLKANSRPYRVAKFNFNGYWFE
ncbi:MULTISPECIES: aryl-sulfate sulfotransferase [Lactobacillus]|uniref:Arylsulfotransferase N-terminal domain-containing protein n=1 Tax=Lactobacillus xujianguonis TaxID=2495899 RepID=A0A437SSI7_9LACO|nr:MULTISPECIES: aryl-sulfate sulfotransferase [Lactobacillus]RVU69880.1 hypothetical protein EJK17_10690 [Lactobacillus xujianguonis]RVU73898.1 hypothetical protein EJK20_05960 [Lactobacillus xujianguonis]